MPSSRPSVRTGPVFRAVAWAGALALAAAVSSWVAAEAVVDPAFVEERVSRTLTGRLSGASVKVGAVRLLPHRLGLSVGGLRVDTRGRSTTAGSGGSWTFLVPSLTVTGVRGSALVGGNDLHLGRVRVTGATVDLSGIAPGSRLAGVANGIDLDLRDVSLTDGGPDLAGLLTSLSRLEVPSYRARSPDGRSLFHLRGFEADLRSGKSRLDAVQVLLTDPAVPRPLRPEGEGAAEDTTEVVLTGLAARGLALVETDGGRPGLQARGVEIDSFRVTAVDGVVPDTSTEGGSPLTPIQWLRQIEGAAGRFDTLSFDRGRVRYTERRVGYPGAGTIVFDRIEGSVRPLPFGPAPPAASDSSPERPLGAPSPVQLMVRGRVARSAPVWLAVSFPDRRRSVHFDAVGKVGSLDLRGLNSIFRPTEGIHIESGRLDSLRFRLRASGGTARGRIVPVYDGLDISLEDPRAGGTGIDEHIRSFVLGLRLNARNDPAEGEDFRTGSLRYESSPGQTFPAFFWQALLTGLQDVAGV